MMAGPLSREPSLGQELCSKGQAMKPTRKYCLSQSYHSAVRLQFTALRFSLKLREVCGLARVDELFCLMSSYLSWAAVGRSRNGIRWPRSIFPSQPWR